MWSLAEWCRRMALLCPGFSHRLAEGPGAANVAVPGTRDRAHLAVGRLAEETGFRARFGLDEAARHFVDWAGRHPGP